MIKTQDMIWSLPEESTRQGVGWGCSEGSDWVSCEMCIARISGNNCPRAQSLTKAVVGDKMNKRGLAVVC